MAPLTTSLERSTSINSSPRTGASSARPTTRAPWSLITSMTQDQVAFLNLLRYPWSAWTTTKSEKEQKPGYLARQLAYIRYTLDQWEVGNPLYLHRLIGVRRYRRISRQARHPSSFTTRSPPPPVYDPQDPEIDEYPEGDYPAGSIFAPGEVWGPGQDHDLDVDEEPDVPLIEGWFGDIIDVFQGQVGGAPVRSATPPIFNPTAPYNQYVGGSPTGIPAGRPAAPPGAAPVLDRYGRPCRRRRRRRLLTNSDLKDLAALKTITGNNDALKMAVIKAVR